MGDDRIEVSTPAQGLREKIESVAETLNTAIGRIGRLEVDAAASRRDDLPGRMTCAEEMLDALSENFNRRVSLLERGVAGLMRQSGPSGEPAVVMSPRPEEPATARKTAWVVKTVPHGAVANIVGKGGSIGTVVMNGVWKDCVLRFPNRSDAETLARLLGIGEPALVYTDTMEEVE